MGREAMPVRSQRSQTRSSDGVPNLSSLEGWKWRAGITPSITLSRIAGWSIDVDGDQAEKVRHAIVAWFTSPLWLQSSTFGTILPVHSDARGEQASAQLGEYTISRFVRDSVAPISGLAKNTSLSWVDHHMLGSYGNLERRHYAAVTAALQLDRPDAVRLILRSGAQVDASLASFFALLLAESTLMGFAPHVTDGIGNQLRRWDPAGAGISMVSLACCLPTLEGMAMRSDVAGGSHYAVPMSIYPLVATLLPEASPYLYPVIDDITCSLVLDSVSSGGLVPLSQGDLILMRIRQSRLRSGRHIAVDCLAFWTRQMRRAKRALRGTPLQYLMERVGLDSQFSRAVLRRLALHHNTNPLVTRRSARHLEKSRQVIPMRVAS